MGSGLVINESLGDRSILERLSNSRVWTEDVRNATPWQPSRWTFTSFEIPDDGVPQLAAEFAQAMGGGPWYMNLSTHDESFVVLAHRIFRYRKNDPAGREAAQAYCREMGIPESQLDWGE